MSKITCIIVEDEPLAVKILSDYIAQVSFLDLQGTFKNALLATDYLQDNIVDLIFLYSDGQDGQSSAPITASKSQDDIIRASDGAYVGLASQF